MPVKEVQMDEFQAIRIEKKESKGHRRASVFYGNNEEIATCKMKGDRIYDVEGKIPNGQVKFINKWKDTFGIEFFKKSKRHGKFVEYYPDGSLRMKALYRMGQLISKEVYTESGDLRKIVKS